MLSKVSVSVSASLVSGIGVSSSSHLNIWHLGRDLRHLVGQQSYPAQNLNCNELELHLNLKCNNCWNVLIVGSLLMTFVSGPQPDVGPDTDLMWSNARVT